MPFGILNKDLSIIMRVDLKNAIRKVIYLLTKQPISYSKKLRFCKINGASSALCLCIITQLLP